MFPRKKINYDKLNKLIKNRILLNKKTFSLYLLPYNNKEVKNIIWSLKFKNNKKLGRDLGIFLYDNIIDILENLKYFNSFDNALIITIPISKKRLYKRGYNQNDLIIHSFINNGGGNFITWEKNNLIKIKETIPQSHLHNKKERLQNPLNSFKLKYPKRLNNKNIIIFDDVYTTGATLKEAKKLIKKSGAKKILLLTIAR